MRRKATYKTTLSLTKESNSDLEWIRSHYMKHDHVSLELVQIIDMALHELRVKLENQEAEKK